MMWSCWGGAYPVADACEERRRLRADAELPLDIVGCSAGGANRGVVDSVQMMGGADRDAIPARVAAAAGTEVNVMIVQVPARAARRDGAPPALAREDRIAMPRRCFP